MPNSNHRSTRLVQISLCLLCQFAFLAAATLQAYATNGLPQSTKFGFGARIDPWGQQLDYALATAADNGLNWMAVDFDWSRSWPSAGSTLDLGRMDYIMRYAEQNGLSVLLSITNPPSWSASQAGPDSQLTTGLVANLVRLYPNALKAIELFPAANTKRGWGALPDPIAYANLFKAVSAILDSAENPLGEDSPAKQPIVLVAAGLVPVNSPDAENIDDQAYLQQLYAAGLADYMSIVSLRFPELSGDPLADPRSSDAQVLRHYELIRSVMLENNHSKGLIWVTGFSWPATLAESYRESESPAALENSQSRWLSSAHQQMKSQLYLGAAFYDCLNPPVAGTDQLLNERCLVRVEKGKASVHPALESIGYLYALFNKQRTQSISPGPGEMSVPFEMNAAWKDSTP